MRKALSVRGLRLAFIGALAGGVSAAEVAPRSLEEPWLLASRLEFNQAYSAFAARKKLPQRTDGLGQAVTLLNVQPITEANIDESERLLNALVIESVSDDVGKWSLYYLGRSAQTHRLTPEPTLAKQHFRRLIELAPGHLAAQVAVNKLGLLIIYDPKDKRLPEHRIAEVEKLGANLSDSDGIRDFHLLIARTRQFFKLPDGPTLDHLLAAEATGRLGLVSRSDVLVSAGMLAKHAGRASEARRAFEMFLEAYPRDNRTLTVRRLLAELH